MPNNKHPEIEKIIKGAKEWISGTVCGCGGGGTDDNNKICKICNGTGIYNWTGFGWLEESLLSFQKKIEEETKEKVKKRLPKEKNTKWGDGYEDERNADGHNDCLDKVKKIIQQLKSK